MVGQRKWGNEGRPGGRSGSRGSFFTWRKRRETRRGRVRYQAEALLPCPVRPLLMGREGRKENNRGEWGAHGGSSDPHEKDAPRQEEGICNVRLGG